MKTRLLLFLLMPFIGLSLSFSTDRRTDPGLREMQRAFQSVPDVKLAVYWYWISDNISQEGVVKDLEAMKEAGINRAFIGNIGLDDMEYGEHKLLSEEWWRIIHTALKKATELDIEIGIFNGPGWSQSGGPWVQPEQSMRYLASTQAVVSGPGKYRMELPSPADRAQDVKVLAYRLVDKSDTAVAKAEKRQGEELELDIHNPEGLTVRSIAIRVDRPVITDAEFYYKDSGGEYRLIKDIFIDRSNLASNVGFDPLAPVVISVPATAATDFRVVLPDHGGYNVEVTLSSVPQVERYPEKTLAKMFQTPLPLWHDYMWDAQPEVEDPSLIVDPADVLDITEYFDGSHLEWNVPEGQWRIERLAMVSTGVGNAPASPQGAGLEVDKMSRKHVAAHFDAFMGEILRRIPAEDRRSFKVVVQDSYETGGQNWTDDMAERFEETYGYDPTPYLPVLSGTVVGSPEMSDRFLWDLRRLIADRVSYDYVGGLRDESHKHGLVTWLENYGHWGFPGEFLQYGGQSDEIGGEFWSEGSLGDIENRAASSSAHIYGKRIVWAESFTAAGPTFYRYPYMMKQRGDRFFTEGINATLLHVYIHQPYENRDPGMNAWFGNEFNRKNTWFSQMDLFSDYLKRTNYMLQQGTYVADAAYFIGEDAPKMTGVCDPALPEGYSFDYINGEVLMKYASVRDGKLLLESGMEYRILVLPKLRTMRTELLSKLRDMVDEGLVILGPAPDRSPSLAGWPHADTDVRALAAELWGGLAPGSYKRAGKGYVFADGCSLEDAFAVLSVAPDLTVTDGAPVQFIHRRSRDAEIYFLANQEERKISFEATFRSGEEEPWLWDAVTGEIRSLPQYSRSGRKIGGERSATVPLELEPYGSAFIVFGMEKGSQVGEDFPQPTLLIDMDNPWEVSFDGMSAPGEPVVFETLYDWKEASDPRIKYFSGTARYKTVFDIGEIPSGQLYLDLGRVMVMGKVYLNGEYAGGVWTYPYRVNVTELIKPGANVLEIDIVNNWMNRIIGDLQLPEEERQTWAPVNFWNEGSELQSSGLLGPVTLQELDFRMK